MRNNAANSKVVEKFREKMHELFQVNRADLDFGMYRIMNAKRDEINVYLENELYTQRGPSKIFRQRQKRKSEGIGGGQ